MRRANPRWSARARTLLQDLGYLEKLMLATTPQLKSANNYRQKGRDDTCFECTQCEIEWDQFSGPPHPKCLNRVSVLHFPLSLPFARSRRSVVYATGGPLLKPENSSGCSGCGASAAWTHCLDELLEICALNRGLQRCLVDQLESATLHQVQIVEHLPSALNRPEI